MPTELQSLLSAGFALMQAQAPAVTVFNGHTFTGVSSPITQSKQLQEQGFLDQGNGVVVLTTADVATASIVDGMVGTVDGVSVRVITMVASATDPTVEISYKHSR